MSTIVVTGQHSAENVERMRQAAHGADLRFVPKLNPGENGLADVEAIAGTINASQLSQAPRLKWVHSWAAGVDNDLFPEMLESPVVLTSSTGNGAIPLAEHSMLLMLMLNRDVPRWMRAQTQKRWERFTHPELNGLTVGIFGLGNSGSDLALKAKAFHMRVLGLRRNADRTVPGVDEMFSPDQFLAFLGESDFVVVTAPNTAETLGLFDAEAFKAMKPSAYFICISRGGIAVDDDLLQALREGWIAGAALDAHGVEPLPPESAFWDLPNVIITPHNGATTLATAQRSIEIFIDNLQRYTAGQPLRNIVDKSAGY